MPDLPDMIVRLKGLPDPQPIERRVAKEGYAVGAMPPHAKRGQPKFLRPRHESANAERDHGRREEY